MSLPKTVVAMWMITRVDYDNFYILGQNLDLLNVNVASKWAKIVYFAGLIRARNPLDIGQSGVSLGPVFIRFPSGSNWSSYKDEAIFWNTHWPFFDDKQ